MTDCIPADAVRELRERWAARAAKRRGISTEPFDEQAWMAVAEEHCVAELDSLIAQARPCDEGLREALGKLLDRLAYEHRGRAWEETIAARTALAEEGKQ